MILESQSEEQRNFRPTAREPFATNMSKFDTSSTPGIPPPRRYNYNTNRPIQDVDDNVENLESILKLEKLAKDVLNSRLGDLLEQTTEALQRVKREGVVTNSVVGNMKGIPDV